MRGNPQTHDIELCASTLQQLRAQRQSAQPASVRVPRFDKEAFSGRGDRLPAERWAEVRAPADVVLLEGWCLGFRAVRPKGESELATPELAPVDEALCAFEHVYALLDALVVIQVASAAVVFRWREEAEARARRDGRGAMSEAEVRAFVECYMPAYTQYLAPLYGEGEGGSGVCAGRPQLRFFIDEAREPCSDATRAAGNELLLGRG